MIVSIRQWKFVGVTLVTIVVDQLSKWYASRMELVQLNSGISFGLFSTQTLTIFLSLFLAIVFLHLGKKYSLQYPGAFGMFIGASLSNILDRILFGGVQDFLPIPFVSLTNNLADWLILVSLVYIMHSQAKIHSPYE